MGNPRLPAITQAVKLVLTHQDHARSLAQRNLAIHHFVRDGMPVSYQDAQPQVIDFRAPDNNRVLPVRERKAFI